MMRWAERTAHCTALHTALHTARPPACARWRTLKHASPQYWVWRHWLHFLLAPNVPQLLHGSPSPLPPPFLAALPPFVLAVLLGPAVAAALVAVVASSGCGF